MRTIGDRLKEQRQRAGLTQSQAAELEGLSRQYIWKLEEGENEPPAWPNVPGWKGCRLIRCAARSPFFICAMALTFTPWRA